MSQITENIYLGDLGDLNDTEYLNQFDAVLCLTKWTSWFDRDPDTVINPIIYYQILEDSSEFPIEDYFDRLHKIIDKYASNGKKIIVCCTAGISRSPTIVISYLMAKHNWTYPYALKYVSSKRGKVCPNFGFQIALETWECYLRDHT